MSDHVAPKKTNDGRHVIRSDRPFFTAMVALGAVYVLLILAMLGASVSFTSWSDIAAALAEEPIRYALWLSLISCTITTILSLWVAVPVGYLLSRFDFPGKRIMDAIFDIPIVLPPLVIGIALLILFQTGVGRAIESIVPVTYEIPSVILAQFAVACAFSVRTLRATFEQIDTRRENVALTLGCNRSQAFFAVVLPEARAGLMTAATIAWARSLGEFGPILVFSGATRMRTEVLPTTIFLELSIGNLEAAVAVSVIMVTIAVVVLVVARWFGGLRHMDGVKGRRR